ncbi:quinone-dependent dihydroorotate dehydrogenase [Bdellovibrionota bacterium FG-2]
MLMLRKLLWKLVKFFLFRFDAEKAHRGMVSLVRELSALNPKVLRIVSGVRSLNTLGVAPVEVLGLEFHSPLGLAAGFDKDCEILLALPHLGFGFAEIGTLTPRAQGGNPRPRLFRDPKAQALFNCMGFNNSGAAEGARRLAQLRERGLPQGFRVGVNVGKNKDTPLERAFEDYAAAIKPFDGLADYIVVNVSSPNTPGLRSLQTQETLAQIMSAVLEVKSGWKKVPPTFLKLAPELEGPELADIIHSVAADGWILTNTLGGTLSRGGQKVQGGWSGNPLREISRRRLVEVRGMTSKPIISVGGILTAAEAIERLNLGANLIQIYSGWILNGPSFPVEILRKIGRKQS